VGAKEATCHGQDWCAALRQAQKLSRVLRFATKHGALLQGYNVTHGRLAMPCTRCAIGCLGALAADKIYDGNIASEI
jgi:hypothetical protein